MMLCLVCQEEASDTEQLEDWEDPTCLEMYAATTMCMNTADYGDSD